jgi:hypothetical protein
MQPLEFAELNRIDRETHVAVAREPLTVMLIVRFRAVADAAFLHVGVPADIENRGHFSVSIFRQIKISRGVQTRHRLVL